MTSPLLVGSSAYPQREASSRPIGVVPIGALPTVQPEKVLVALQQRTLLTKRQSPGSGAQIQLRTDGAGVAGRPRFVSDTENTRVFYTLTYRCPAYRPCLSEKDTDTEQ